MKNAMTRRVVPENTKKESCEYGNNVQWIKNDIDGLAKVVGRLKGDSVTAEKLILEAKGLLETASIILKYVRTT